MDILVSLYIFILGEIMEIFLVVLFIINFGIVKENWMLYDSENKF